MPLTAASLKEKIVTKMEAIWTFEDSETLDDFAQALAEAIVEEITTNAVVVVASVTAVTPGVGVSGPGTGTVT